MKEDVKPWHMSVLNQYRHTMYESLLHPHNVVSENLKEVVFENRDPCRGYFVKKDKVKYWIDDATYDSLPVRLGDHNEELIYKEDVVIHPMNPKKFKIVPTHSFKIREFVDMFVPFQHNNPEHWFLMKVVALMGFIGRTYICVSSESQFGKSSVFDVIHSLTDKSPVFRPRSVPGVLQQITGNGNMVFDEAHRCRKDVIDIMEEFSLKLADGSPNYINGAMRASSTRENYDCRLQSITYLYNNTDHYKNPEKNYFECMFGNNTAIDTRFLKLKLDGILTEKFDRGFDIPGIAENNKHFYISIAKELLYLQELRLKNGYKRRHQTNTILGMEGRRRQVYNELTWLLDMYSNTQAEYDDWIRILDECIIAYKEMVNMLKGEMEVEVEEIGSYSMQGV